MISVDKNWQRKQRRKEVRVKKNRNQNLNEMATQEHGKRQNWKVYSVLLLVVRRIKVKRNQLLDQGKRKYPQRGMDEYKLLPQALQQVVGEAARNLDKDFQAVVLNRSSFR